MQIWKEFLHYVHDGGGWRGIEFNLPSLVEPAAPPAGAPDADLDDLAAQFAHNLDFASDDDADDILGPDDD